MSDNFVIDPDQLPFPLHHKAIRSSSFRGTNTLASRYSCPNSRSLPAGRVEPQLNGLVGGIEPDLNGFLSWREGVELESNCSVTAVILRFG